MGHFIGIDNSSLDHKVRIIDDTGKLKSSFTIPNTYQGFEELNKRARRFSPAKIGFELPHGPIVDYLHDKTYEMYSLNPLKIKRYKETINVSGNKNDIIDAQAIADYLRSHSDNVRQLTFNSSEIEKLKTLSIIHTRLIEDRANHLNKLHFIVRQYYPIQDTLFLNFGCSVQLKMIKKYPSFKQLRQASDKEITEFLRSNHHRRPASAKRIIGQIRGFCQLISPEVEFAYQVEAHCVCDILLNLEQYIKKTEVEMNQITDNHRLGKNFRSLPGAGKVLACKLLALFGDNKDRYANANSAQCLFGTAPRNYQSGEYHKVIMRQACNKSSRALLFKYAFGTIQLSKWAKKYYYDQREKGKTHSVAVRALSNKWVKVIFRIWKDETLYEEQKKLAVA